jgi:IMP cyclohydrolase
VSSTLAPLAAMEYPGRAIILGRSRAGGWLVGYVVTGRSPSSRARRLAARSDGHLYTEPSDPAVLATGNPALLMYPAMMSCDCGLVVSNGAQTEPVHRTMCNHPELSAAQVLEVALAGPVLVEGIDVTSFEPDAPNFTPRISGCVRSGSAALTICRRRDDGSVDRSTFDVSDTAAGRGWLLSTYTGVNTNPLPAFVGQPLSLGMDIETASDLAGSIYATLAPSGGRDDLRVAVAAVALGDTSPYVVMNRLDVKTGQ